MWPIIQRELREEARRPLNRRLRLVSAAVGLLTLLFVIFSLEPAGVEQGLYVLVWLHRVTLAVIWLFVPLMTADCISCEKREGTLGLLFLTPLKAGGIMVGKGLVQAMRAMTVWWAGLPAQVMPLLMGGVAAADVLAALCIQLSSILLALAVGLLASSFFRRREHAMMGALIGAFFCLAQVGWIVDGYLIGRAAGHDLSLFASIMKGLQKLAGGWVLFPRWTGWGVIRPITPVATFTPWVLTVLKWVLANGLVLMGVILVASRRLKTSWKERVASPAEEVVRRRWLRPRFGLHFFRRRQRSLLDNDPIGWLQQYSVTDRLIKWGLCLALVIWETLLMREYNYSNYFSNGFISEQYWTGVFISVTLAFSAAGSFQRERESGALELILVTPIREQQLILGRLGGIWWQFLPGLVPVLLVWLFWWESDLWYLAGGLVVDFVALPMVGFYLSLRLRHFFAVWIITALTGFLVPALPWLGAMAISYATARTSLVYFSADAYEVPLWLLGMGLELMVGLVCAGLLFLNISRRRFALQRVV